MAAALDLTVFGVEPSGDAVQLTLDALMPPEPGCEGEEGELSGVSEGADGERGPGRPPGARNKATVARVEWLERQYTNPLETCAKISHVDPFQLAELLNSKYGVPIKFTLSWWKEITLAQLPYRAKKQPVAIDVAGKGRFTLILEDTPVGADDEDAEDVLARAFAVDVEGFEVSDDETAENSQKLLTHGAKSDDGKSDGTDKALEGKEK